MSEKFTCEICGKEFDSQRGLSIHKSKVHKEEAKKAKKAKKEKRPKNVINSYKVIADKAPAEIKIIKDPKEYVPIYAIKLPRVSPATQVILDKVRESLIKEVRLRREEMLDPRAAQKVKEKFRKAAFEELRKEIPGIRKEQAEVLIGLLLHEMLGLGNIEFLLNDGNLEEIAVNTSSEPIWVYHKEHGWLKTNIILESEERVENLASSIGRKVGRQITTLNPLLDAHLVTGDRVNATLFPITTKGNTITIRMFRRKPWTITDLIKNKTTNTEVTSLLWLCTQYEISYLISGGTSSGKCVSGDTDIILANGEKRKARDLVEEIFEKNKPKKTEDGFMVSNSNLRVLTLDKDLKIKPAKVSRVWKRKAPEYLYRIKMKGGYEIKTTAEHPFFTIKDGKLVKTRADKLDVNTRIALSKKLVNQPIEPNLRKKIIHDLDRGYVDFTLPKELTLEGFNKLTVRSWKKGTNKVPIKIAKEIKDDFRWVYSRHGKKVLIPKEITSELMELVGYVIGDGHLSEGYVEFHNSNEFLLKKFTSLSKDVFKADAKIEYPKNRTPKVRISSTVLSEIFHKSFGVPFGKKSSEVRVPRWVLKLENSKISALIRALFDAEANINFDKGEIEFTSSSEQLIKDLMLLLKRFGISCRYDVRKEGFRLRIYEPCKFKKKIGYSHPRKVEKLEMAAQKNPTFRIDSVPGVSELFTNLKEKLNVIDKEVAKYSGLSRRGFGRIRNGNRVPSRKTLRNLISGFQKLAGRKGFNGGFREIEKLDRLASSDIFWGRVKQVEKIRNGGRWVYDLTVPETHNFIAGESGDFIIHNTTFLNVLLPFIPANQRVISIEQTRELSLPKFLHWIPMVTREPNPEGKGGVDMNDLMINSLRMRPDRIVVGEVRRAAEAETLFEAARTGHSVYATVHADTAEQTLRRLTTPPINLPEASIEAVPLIVVMFRDRRKGIRRIFQIAETMPAAEARGEEKIRMNLMYRWRPKTDEITKHSDSIRLMDELRLHTGMSKEEIKKDMKERQEVLRWMVKNDISTLNTVGKTVSSYYSDKDLVLDVIRNNKDRSKILGDLVKEL